MAHASAAAAVPDKQKDWHKDTRHNGIYWRHEKAFTEFTVGANGSLCEGPIHYDVRVYRGKHHRTGEKTEVYLSVNQARAALCRLVREINLRPKAASFKQHGSGGRARGARQAAAAGFEAAAAGAPPAHAAPSSSSVCQVASLQQGMGPAKHSDPDPMEVVGPYNGAMEQQEVAAASANGSFSFPQLAPAEQTHPSNPFAAAAAGVGADAGQSDDSNSQQDRGLEPMDVTIPPSSGVLQVYDDSSSADSDRMDDSAADHAPIRQGPSLLQGSSSGSATGVHAQQAAAAGQSQQLAAAAGQTQQLAAAAGQTQQLAEAAGQSQQLAEAAGGCQQHAAAAGEREQQKAASEEYAQRAAASGEYAPPAAAAGEYAQPSGAAGLHQQHASYVGGFAQQRASYVGGLLQQRAAAAGEYAPPAATAGQRQQRTAAAGGRERRAATAGSVLRGVQKEQLVPDAMRAWKPHMAQQQQAVSPMRAFGSGRVVLGALQRPAPAPPAQAAAAAAASPFGERQYGNSSSNTTVFSKAAAAPNAVQQPGVNMMQRPRANVPAAPAHAAAAGPFSVPGYGSSSIKPVPPQPAATPLVPTPPAACSNNMQQPGWYVMQQQLVNAPPAAAEAPAAADPFSVRRYGSTSLSMQPVPAAAPWCPPPPAAGTYGMPGHGSSSIMSVLPKPTAVPALAAPADAYGMPLYGSNSSGGMSAQPMAAAPWVPPPPAAQTAAQEPQQDEQVPAAGMHESDSAGHEQAVAHAQQQQQQQQQQEQMGWFGSASRFIVGWGGGGYNLPK